MGGEIYDCISRKILFLWGITMDIIISSAIHIADFLIDHKV